MNKKDLKAIVNTFRNKEFTISLTSDSISEIEKNRKPYNFYERLKEVAPVIIKKSDYIKSFCKKVVWENDYEERYNKLVPIKF